MPKSARDRRTLPGNPASAVYGTVLVAGQLAVESATKQSTGQMIGSLAATLGVFWLAHAYTDSMGAAITADAKRPPSLTHALREEWPIVESGVLPSVALAVAAVGGASPANGALAGLIVSVLELVGWGALAARRAKLTGGRMVLAALAAGGLGVLIVALKYLIH